LLRRQLKRCFQSVDGAPPELERFIEAVDAAYRQSDSDRLMLERSFELTSIELNQANTNLRAAIMALHESQIDLEARVQARMRDLAERDEQLRQVQKMESIGRLAGGVAHDFNNLLTVIFGNSDLLLASSLCFEDRAAVEQIRKAADSAASLTRQLLAFSRQQFLTPKVIDLNELVESIERLLGRLIGEDIEIVTELEPGACPIRADPGQIQQVLLNLVINARDAMPDGGTLTISTRASTVERDAAPSGDVGVKPGAYVSLAVADTGTGMKPEVRTRVFEPFFTTKELGRGTGLGLATVYGIVQQSGGYIDLTSEEGHGTIFRVLFPREAVAAEPLAAERRRQEGRAAGVILLAEDQDGVRALARDFLRRKGYTVVEATDGVDALTKCDGLPHLDLLLTDVVMPRMNGRTLASRLAELRPGLKILYMTGYIDDADLVRAVRDSQVPVLQKPFSADGLLRMVRETLESAS
jgi:signal transduction histidine kinase/CheY-like chemotaxis protein